MTVAGHRHERVAEEIHHEMSAMLAGELKDPRVSPDLKQARVYVSINGNETEQAAAMKGLEAAAGFIRHELAERMQTRRSPELHFVLDRSEEYADRIERLLKEAKNASAKETRDE